jgi:hypothetical protein
MSYNDPRAQMRQYMNSLQQKIAEYMVDEAQDRQKYALLAQELRQKAQQVKQAQIQAKYQAGVRGEKVYKPDFLPNVASDLETMARTFDGISGDEGRHGQLEKTMQEQVRSLISQLFR